MKCCSLANSFYLLLILLLIANSSCSKSTDLKPYEYEEGFLNYMNYAFAETTFYDKDYLLVLPDQACLACVGDLYQSIQSIQDNTNFLVIWVQSKPSVKDTVTSNFPIVLKDKEGVLQRYETNIGGPTFFKIENNQLFNQTNLNAETWKELSIIYQW